MLPLRWEPEKYILHTIYTSDSVDPDGNTILCAAARWGHKRIVRRALKWHCELNHYNDDGMTAVELAVIHSHESVAEYLIEKDAELTMFGRTLLHEAAQCKMNNLATALLQRLLSSLRNQRLAYLDELSLNGWSSVASAESICRHLPAASMQQYLCVGV